MDDIEFPRSFRLVICAVATGIAGIISNRRMIGTATALLLLILAVLNVRMQSRRPGRSADSDPSPFDK